MRTIVVHRACVVILLAGLSTRAASAGERYIAYQVPSGTLGNQDAPGALGKDFDVNVSIEVTRLGVFDSGSDGLALPITARLYDRDTGIERASLAFTPDDPGELVGGSRFKDLETPLELPPGFHGCIIAEGYGAAEMNGNCHGNLALRAWTTDDGNCSLEFVGGSRYGADHGILPAWVDGGPADRYAAGTFEFIQLDEPIPVPATAYLVDAFTMGNYPFSGPMGMDFDVEGDILVTRLGVFDSSSDGLLLPLTARLYDRDSQVEIASLEFPSEDPGDLVDGSRFKDLDPPLELPAGARCTIVAEGYGTLEPAGSLWAGALPIRTDSGGCSIRFVGSSRMGFVPEEFPAAPDFGPANRYAAGTFAFEPAPGPVTAPSAPTGVQATVVAGGVEVAWTAPSVGPAPAGYNVYRKVGEAIFKANVGLVTQTRFTDSDTAKGVETCWVVRSALSSGVQSPASAEACALRSAPAAPAATHVAWTLPADLPGNQTAAGSLGMDFVTETEIVVTRLGVFDDRSDGLSSTLTVRLWDLGNRSEVASVVFTPGDPGDLVGGARFKDLGNRVGLPAGFRGTVAAEGFAATDMNGNRNVTDSFEIATDAGGCAIRFGGHRSGLRGAFPGTREVSVHVAAFATGTFEYGVVAPPPARPSEGVAYVVPAGTRGNQNYAGALGLDFVVERNIVVTRLGVFDDGSDGLLLPITARLWDRAAGAEVATLAFGPDDSGELVGGSRFKDLEPPVSLAAGFRGTIVAEGYGDLEMNGNVHGIEGLAPWTTFDGGCAISFVGGGRPGTAGTLPAGIDGGPADRYAAGTFQFRPGPVASFTATPEEGPEPLQVTLDATASSSPNGAIVSYLWDFGEGTAPGAATLTRTFTTLGLQTVTLTVEDSAGFRASASRTVTVLFRSGDVSPWTSEDVGDPQPAVTGGARPDGGCLELYAGGNDIGSTVDQFHFVHQQATGDAKLTVRLARAVWESSAKVGLMVREDLTPGSRHASILAVNGISPRYSLFQRRTANGATTVVETSGERPIPPDAWMRIERAGSDVIASFSADGTAWTELGRVVVALPETVHIGMAATSRDPSGSRKGLEATFCDVALDAGDGGPAFRRGDANDDGSLNITDGIFTLNFLFLGGATPPCTDAADSNDDAAVNITDGIFVLNFLFLGGPEPPAPGPTDCGPDPTADENAECAPASCP